MRSTRCGALREEIPQVLKEKWNSFRVCSLCSLTPIVSAGVVGRILETCCATYCVPINITHLIYRTALTPRRYGACLYIELSSTRMVSPLKAIWQHWVATSIW